MNILKSGLKSNIKIYRYMDQVVSLFYLYSSFVFCILFLTFSTCP